MTVVAAHEWRTNGALIADVARLGYIGDRCLDLSYGLGRFWTDWKPGSLVANDLNPEKGDHHHDVAGAPPVDWYSAFETVVWDGPYRMSGTRDRGGFDAGYGLDGPAPSPDQIIGLLKDGVWLAEYCVEAGGTVLVKCQDQVCSGRKWWQTRILADYGETLGLRLADQFHLVRPVRAQPAGRAQVHARSNYSTLLVFRA